MATRNSTAQDQDDILAKAMDEIQDKCLKFGLTLPMHGTVTAGSGTILAVQWAAGSKVGTPEGKLPAEHPGSDGTKITPINITIYDDRGKTAKVEIGPDGKPQLMY